MLKQIVEEIKKVNKLPKDLQKLLKEYDPYVSYINDGKTFNRVWKRNQEIKKEFEKRGYNIDDYLNIKREKPKPKKDNDDGIVVNYSSRKDGYYSCLDYSKKLLNYQGIKKIFTLDKDLRNKVEELVKDNYLYKKHPEGVAIKISHIKDNRVISWYAIIPVSWDVYTIGTRNKENIRDLIQKINKIDYCKGVADMFDHSPYIE